MNSGKKSFLTPCRQVGLKRKSFGFTPPLSQNVRSPQTVPTMVTATDDPVQSIQLIESLERNQTTPTTPKQPQLKRVKNSIVRQIATMSETVLPLQQIENEELSLDDIQLHIDQIKERISMKHIQIANLNLQSVNSKPHDLPTLKNLTSKWRLGCQDALNELLIEYTNSGRNCSMLDLLQSLGIPAELVQYSETEMDFRV